MRKKILQAYKLKGKIDLSGHLIITEPTDLVPGDVEVIILQEVKKGSDSVNHTTETLAEKPEITPFPCRTKIFRDLLANVKPVSPDFDPEQVLLEALEEKYL